MCCEIFISISFTLLLYDTEQIYNPVSHGSDFIFKQNPVSTKSAIDVLGVMKDLGRLWSFSHASYGSLEHMLRIILQHVFQL